MLIINLSLLLLIIIIITFISFVHAVACRVPSEPSTPAKPQATHVYPLDDSSMPIPHAATMMPFQFKEELEAYLDSLTPAEAVAFLHDIELFLPQYMYLPSMLAMNEFTL